MKILLHICCAPCAIYPFRKLVADGYEVTAFWYNPNIHPYTEYKNRLDSVRLSEKLHQWEIQYLDEYELEKFLKAASDNPEFGVRCRHCYRMRLERAAEFAKANGFEVLTTTLSVSPHQDHSLIKEEGERAAEKFGVRFHYQDFTSGYREAHEQATEKGLYMQKYCGCIYSERDRYDKKFRRKAQKSPARATSTPASTQSS
jgi:predicted adenine nucleotide alpha hydrolase (AANH) superfamily ATPase